MGLCKFFRWAHDRGGQTGGDRHTRMVARGAAARRVKRDDSCAGHKAQRLEEGLEEDRMAGGGRARAPGVLITRMGLVEGGFPGCDPFHGRRESDAERNRWYRSRGDEFVIGSWDSIDWQEEPLSGPCVPVRLLSLLP